MQGIDRLLAELTEWSADQRADDAADARARGRSLRSQLEESATLAGTLVDLTEAGGALSVQTTRGRVHRGLLAGVGADFLAVRSDDGALVVIALHAVVAVRPGTGNGAATGARSAGRGTLVQFLARCAEEHPRVRLVAAGEPVAGELVAVGADVLSVRSDADPPGVSYVPAASVSEVSLG
ncbi:MAG: hypothetical protein QOJ09_2582 [Actinomycetota bacterium]|nr:hypothetical protein [Actinomycetota bacterium]